MTDGAQTNPSLDRSEHVDENISAKRIASYYWDGSNWQRQGAGLIPASYDYMAYTNTNTTTDTFVYKTGGSGGTTVATVTITYTDTTKGTVSTVTRT